MSKASDVVNQEGSTYAEGLVSPMDTRATQQINGNGIAAEKWVPSIEELTQQNNLRFLTFLPWKGVLSNRTMHRRSRAWCPSCLEDQRVAGMPPHEQLRWAHRIVHMCSDHKVRLETECPHCKSNSGVLCGSSRPGLCSQCKSWLGYYPNNVSPALTEYDTTNAAIEVFIAEQIGEIVASAAHLTRTLTQDTPRISITKCVDRFFDGNFNAFIRFFGMKKGSNNYFYTIKPRFIDLELLLKVAFHTGTTLLNLLTNNNALADFNPSVSTSPVSKRLSPRLKKENVLTKLLEAIVEKPPPSLNEIGERLGYRSTYTLRRYFPQVCDQLGANYLTYSPGKRRGGWSTTRRQSNEAILAALEAALKEEPPPSLGQVARSLGYVSAQTLRPRFPEICKALAEKRKRLASSRRTMIEGELRQAIESDPPIPLNAISEKMGYKSTAMLSTAFPRECREIRQRHEKHAKNQLLAKIEVVLQSILIEIPPPPLNVSIRRIGVSDAFLRKYFPKEHRAISARYLEFRHQQSLKNKEVERKNIRELISDLINRGEVATMEIVLDLLHTTYLSLPELWATIRQAREEFAPKA